MVYVCKDGNLRERQPMGFSSIFGFFWGILNFLYLFVCTLLTPATNRRDPRYTVDYRPPGSGPADQPRFRGMGPSGAPGAPPAPGCGCGG